mmetsp:Transcript_28060/g.5123  ORF Transcript_28060/g.5123 Transcript_28060/m.5123 type:complete len:81 (+) Transcript_28060:256-498(+)
MKTSDYVFFTIELDGSTKHCVASYRQIPNNMNDAEMTRNYVQKSVVVVSNVPLYAAINKRIEIITHAYFEQGDFGNTEIL